MAEPKQPQEVSSTFSTTVHSEKPHEESSTFTAMVHADEPQDESSTSTTMAHLDGPQVPSTSPTIVQSDEPQVLSSALLIMGEPDKSQEASSVALSIAQSDEPKEVSSVIGELGDNEFHAKIDEEYQGPLYTRPWLDNVEDRERYIPGGYHPIHLGDTIGTNNRFRVLHKLGSGGFSTVWLCRDDERDRYVSLKIIMANASKDDCPELRLMKKIEEGSLRGEGKECLELPKEYFWIEGPNGRHLVFVLPVLGPRLEAIWRMFTDLEASKMARDVVLQVTKGLRFLHKNGICHGDFRPSNILMRLHNFEELSEEELNAILGEPQRDPVLTRSSEEDPGPSAPKYTVAPVSLRKLGPKYISNQACIIDFGESYEIAHPPQRLGLPRGYCSPELIFDNLVGIGCDHWALACTIYELRSMSALFESWDGSDEEIIEQMARLLGKLPEPWWGKWEKRNLWFEENGEHLIDEKTGEAFASKLTIEGMLEEGVHFGLRGDDRSVEGWHDNVRPVDIVVPEDERVVLADLMMRMLKYDEKERISVDEVLEHPWFKLDSEKDLGKGKVGEGDKISDFLNEGCHDE